MTYKIVINACYGGFSLSDKAVQILREVKNDPDINNYSFDHYEGVYYRHDKDLVDVVERLGKESCGKYAALKVVEIEGNAYRITEYDGRECVQTPSSVDWVIIEKGSVGYDTEI